MTTENKELNATTDAMSDKGLEDVNGGYRCYTTTTIRCKQCQHIYNEGSHTRSLWFQMLALKTNVECSACHARGPVSDILYCIESTEFR